MLEEEYQARRALPRHLRKSESPETPFAFEIRPARAADLPAVREIYNYYVANSMVTFDEDAMTLREWKQKFSYLNRLGMPFLVAESPTGQLLGYALVSPWKQRGAHLHAARKLARIARFESG
jgi:phosphinothricin acetyltransferase